MKKKPSSTKQLMCIVHSHYIINCHITTNMEISHLQLKLVGCFSPYFCRKTQKMKISFFFSPHFQSKSTAHSLCTKQRKNISVNICAHEFSLSGTLICWHFRKMMLVYCGVGLSPPAHIHTIYRHIIVYSSVHMQTQNGIEFSSGFSFSFRLFSSLWGYCFAMLCYL